MSRSYKKHLWICPKSKYFKNLANRRIRRMKFLHNKGCRYKKITRLAYDICDYKFMWDKSFENSSNWVPKWKWGMK